MEVVFYAENEIFDDETVCRGCERIAREAQAQNVLNTMMYAGDAGSFIAFEDDDVVGYLSLSIFCTPELDPWWINNDTVYVEQVVVDADMRGCGIMTAIYEELESTGWFSRILCEINENNWVSQRAHQALGFENVGRHSKALIFSKDLS